MYLKLLKYVKVTLTDDNNEKENQTTSPYHKNLSDFPDISSQGTQPLHCNFKLLPSQGTVFKVQDKLTDLLEQLCFLAIFWHVEMEKKNNKSLLWFLRNRAISLAQ